MFRWVLKFLFVVAVFSAVAGFSAFFTISFFIKGEESVVIPDLVRKDAVSALQLLSALELNTRVQGFEYDDDIPKNHVIHQSPRPGRTLKKGRDVSLVISKGTHTITLPDLKGRNLAQARIILEDNGLALGNQTTVYADAAMRDTVISQYPVAGKTMKRSTTVDLLVSRGPRPAAFKMPDLNGRFLDETILEMDSRKLFLDAINTVYNKSKPENMVVGQDPPAGHYVEANRKVRLTVNRRSKGEHDLSDTRRLFTFRIPQGYLNQHVRLEMSIYGMNLALYDELMKPGRELWVVVPRHAKAAVFLYLNDELVKTEIYH
jgi:eukaryotic-like serine/threonine-protein kinase